MKQPKYTPAEEQALMAFLWSPEIAKDPLAYVMAAYPWGQAGTPLARFKGPRAWQKKVLNEIKNHIIKCQIFDLEELLRIARASGRGIGKSALVAWIIDWFNTTVIGSTAIVSANTEDQLRKITFAEIAKWTAMSIHEHWWEVSGITRTPAKWLKELVETQLQKGTGNWGAFGKLWSEENPDAYAGVHNQDGVLLIFDEASGIPDSIWAVGNGFFTDMGPKYWFAFSQGRRNQGYFYDIFNAKAHLWESDQIDARTVEGTDHKVYEEIIEEYGEESDEARVEVYGLFPSDDDVSFISPVLVKKAVDRYPIKDPTAPIVIGVDPAAFGDKFTIYIRQGLATLDVREFKLTDDEVGTMEGVQHVADAIDEFNPALTVIDETGLGIVIKHRLTELGYKVKGVNFSWKSSDPKRWGNKRAEMWGKMKKWLETGAIPPRKGLTNGLAAPKKKPDSKGAMFLESKKDMKARKVASPDEADALCVTFAFPVAHRDASMSTGNRRKRGRMGAGRVLAGGVMSNSWMGN